MDGGSTSREKTRPWKTTYSFLSLTMVLASFLESRVFLTLSR